MDSNDKNIKRASKKKRGKYKTSRILIVVVATVVAILLIFSGIKFIGSFFKGETTVEDVKTTEVQQIELAESIIGLDIIYVEATFEDEEGKKHKGMAFLSEEKLLFLDSKDYQKLFEKDFLQDISITTGSEKYEFAITDEDGSIYSFSNIVMNDTSEAFMVILNR